MTPDDAALARAFETTWPAAEFADTGGFRVGRGLGAGGRVSSARAWRADWSEDDIAAAEALHRGWGQRALFRLPDSDRRLADTLTRRGYRMEIPTAVMVADCDALADRMVPEMTAFAIWPPLAIQADIWASGSINAARQAVMTRGDLPRSALLARIEDRAAGAGFVATDGPVAMVHAIEVLPAFRHRGLASWLLRKAAEWGRQNGAHRLGLAVSRANQDARALYERMGFHEAGGYGYWAKD